MRPKTKPVLLSSINRRLYKSARINSGISGSDRITYSTPTPSSSSTKSMSYTILSIKAFIIHDTPSDSRTASDEAPIELAKPIPDVPKIYKKRLKICTK